MVDKEADKTEKRTNVYAAVGVGFVCVIVGLPLWWKTTEVYRVSLPYTDIQTLATTKIRYTVDLNVVNFVKGVPSADLSALSKQLLEKLESQQKVGVSSHYRTLVREASTTEQDILSSSRQITDLESRLTLEQGNSANVYSVNVVPADSPLGLHKPTLAYHRSLFIPYNGKVISELCDVIVETVQEVLVRESTVIKRYNTARGARNLKPDKEMMRSLKFHPGYDITLTLISPRPDVLDVQWDAEAGINAYLNPLVKAMSNYSRLIVKSQVLFFTKLHTRPKKDNNEYFFTRKELPHMINPLEAKLGSPASTNPELNFLVYVPSSDQFPLYIRDEQGNKVESNSFLSPQWGGIYIYNLPPPTVNDTLPVQKSLDMGRVMEVFVSQLRLLLNLHSQSSSKVEVLPMGRDSVTEWELDRWLRTRCVENLATSAATLNSLAQLLAKISNIVINDDIGREVQQAVTSMRQAHELLTDGHLVDAYFQSRSAIQASEKAFFDPSLLELLYFPEDQKFAIYIPLFLPISFPVLASLWQSYKWVKGKDKPKTE